MSAFHKLQVLPVITLLMPLAAHANLDAGKFYFIAGTALIYPNLKYDDPTLQLDKNISVLGSFLQNRQISIPGTAIDVSDISLLGGSLGYQVTDHLALEAVAGFPDAIHTEQWFMRLDAKYLRIYVKEVKLKVNALDQALNITIANAQMALPLISFGIGRSF
jgi:hypothetical protein